jgi:type I restriction enzyme S subunit
MWAWMGALGITEYAGIVSPSYHVYRLKKDQTPDYFPKYLDFLYRISSYVCEITRHSKGIWSSRLRLYPDHFFEMYTPSPPLEEQRTIATYLDRETAKIDALIAEIKTGIAHLEEYRTALISAAVTGKIDVRDVLPTDAPAQPHSTEP